MEANQNPVKTASVIHFAMCAGTSLFLAVAALLRSKSIEGLFTEFNPDSVYLFIAPGLALGAIIIGSILYSRTIAAIEPELPLSEKLKKYQSALIIGIAFAEGGALFNTVVFLMEGGIVFFLTALVSIMIMLTYRPTVMKVTMLLGLSFDEQSQLQ